MQERLIDADRMIVRITKTRWQLYRQGDDHGAYGTIPLFEAVRGGNVMTYDATYANHVRLPGTQCSVDYVQAVLVGYHEERGRWYLGLHMLSYDHIRQDTSADKPQFKRLMRWPEEPSYRHAGDVRTAAHALAMMLSAPLKVFGEKKLPTDTDDPLRSGVTGPLEPHMRQRVETDAVQAIAVQIDLPIKGEGFVLKDSAMGITLHLPKGSGAGGQEAPVFNLVDFNKKAAKISLIPPTGLLGTFMKTRGQEYDFAQVQNVEHRYIRQEVSHNIRAEDGNYQVENLTYQHSWGVYLTLPDRSLLLIQHSYQQSPELLHSRLSTLEGGKRDTESAEGFRYFNEHLEEQNRIDAYKTSTEHTAYRLANIIGCPLVMTEVGIER